MKFVINRKQAESLSKKGTLAWRSFCIENDWGTVFDKDDYVEVLQPSIGQLMFYMREKGLEYLITHTDAEPIDILWLPVRRDLES